MMRSAVTGPIPLTFWSSKAEALLTLIFAVLGAIFEAGLAEGLAEGAAIVLGSFAITVIPFEAEAATPAKTGAAHNRPRPPTKARTFFDVNIVLIFG